MSKEIPPIGIPFKLPDTQNITFDWSKLGNREFDQSLFGNYLADQNTEEKQKEEIKLKVKELQSKFRPEVPKLSDEFLEKTIKLAQKIKCTPEDLLAIMYQESGGWNPASTKKDKNGNILYGGLIQMNNQSLKTISKKYAKALNLKQNISMQEYLKLSREEQLKYAEGYFISMKEICNLGDKEKLTAGETWGLLKSPRLTKAHNDRFLHNLENHIKRIKTKIFKEEIHNLDVKN